MGVEYDGTTTFFDKAYKYLTLFLNLYTLQAGQPHVVFRPGGIQIDDFTKLGEISYGYPEHKPIVWIKEPVRAQQLSELLDG